MANGERHHETIIGPIYCLDGRDPTILTAWIDDGAGPVHLVIAIPA